MRLLRGTGSRDRQQPQSVSCRHQSRTGFASTIGSAHLKSTNAQRVGEAWRVLQLAAWMTSQSNASQPIVPDLGLLSEDDLQDRPCTA